MCIGSNTDRSFIARLPLSNCYGSFNLPLFNVSQNHYKVYHLSRDRITCLKNAVNEIQLSVQSVTDLTSNLDSLPNLFIRRVLFNEDVNKKSYLNYVKNLQESGYCGHKSGFLEEIRVASPSGLHLINSYKSTKKKETKRETTAGGFFFLTFKKK